MIRTVVYGSLEVDDFETAQRAVLRRFADTVVDRLDEFLGNRTADDGVFKRIEMCIRDRN